ncbi:MAG: lysophospholipid acyltransferase family protein [Candidatus Adiutrix sp.]
MNNPVIKVLYVMWYVPTLVICTVVAAVVAMIASLFSAKACRYISNSVWGHIVLKPAGIKLTVSGQENLPPPGAGGFIIYANHTSLLDIPTVSLATGRTISWVAKASLGRIPFFGWALRRGHMLVDRGGGSESARKMVAEATKRLTSGEILAIFPEGTRNRSQTALLPFKKGTFILAKHTEAPIIPFAITGAKTLWPADHFWPKPGTIEVKIGPPLLPKKDENLNNLSQRAQLALETLL